MNKRDKKQQEQDDFTESIINMLTKKFSTFILVVEGEIHNICWTAGRQSHLLGILRTSTISIEKRFERFTIETQTDIDKVTDRRKREDSIKKKKDKETK